MNQELLQTARKLITGVSDSSVLGVSVTEDTLQDGTKSITIGLKILPTKQGDDGNYYG